MANSINSKAKEYYDNDDTGGSLNSNLKDFLIQQGATGKSINTLWRDYAYGEGGTSLNTRLRNLWGTSGSLMKRWKETLGLTWDEVKAFFNFRDIEPDFLLDGSTSFDGTDDYISLPTLSPSGTWSISFWFKATIEDNGAIYTNVNGTSNYISIGMWDGKIQMNCADTGGTDRATTSTYNDGVWHHAVLIKKDTSNCSAIYIDGELASSNNINSWAGTNSRDEHTIGVAEYSTDQYYNGRIASLGLWNRELSASEVESIHWRGSHSELKDTELTNLVSWYDLQGDVLDKQGSNDGTNNGATLNSDSYSGESPFKPRIQDKAATSSTDPSNFGEVYSGRALDFDGTNDKVDIPNSSEWNMPKTVSMWFNCDSITANGISSFEKDTLMGYDTIYWGIQLDSTNNKIQYYYYDGAQRYWSTDSSITLNKWHHLAVVSSSSGSTIYLDGLNIGTNSLTWLNNNVPSPQRLRISSYGATSNIYRPFDGKINHVKIFNTELTQDQVRELYTKPETVLPTGVSASNLKLDLPMQEKAGSIVYDGSGNQNHGLIAGATWVSGQEYGYQASLVRSNTPIFFDGSNDYVSCGNIGITDYPFTYSAWFRTNGTTKNTICALADADQNVIFYQFLITDTGLARINARNTADDFCDSSGTYNDGEWHHGVAVFASATDRKIYIDGVADGSDTSSVAFSSGVDEFSIGVLNRSSKADYYDDDINEVAVWDVALDADAVSALYNSGIPLLPTSDSGNYDNSSNLVGYWRNDGNTTWTDRSTNSNNGTASGSPVSIVIPEGSTEGRDSQGYYLSDTTTISNGIRLFEGEYIEVDDSEVLQNIFDGGGSVEVWIYAKGWGESDTGRIITKCGSGNSNGWNIFIENGGRLYLRSDWSTTDMVRYATSAINLNQWHHIAITYNSTASAGTDPIIYVDGVSKTLSGTASAGTVVSDAGQKIRIGARGTGLDREFDGLIDEVRLYDKILSADEVSKNYTNGLGKHS